MQLHISISTAAAALLLAGTALAGEGSDALPANAVLADYVRIGLKNHPGLKSEFEKYRAALERIPQAKSLPDPMVSWTHSLEEVQTRTGPNENMLMVSQTIPWMGKLRLRGDIASHEARAAHSAYEQRRLAFIREMSMAYYEYAYLGKATTITAESLELLHRLEESVEAKVRSGGDYAPKLKVDVERIKTEDLARTLRRDRVRASATIEKLLGRKPGGKTLPWPRLDDGAVPALDGPALRARMLARNPSLVALEEKSRAAAERARLARRSPIPDPNIGVAYTDIGGKGNDAVGVTLGFRIPLWFGKYRAERREAEALQQSVREESVAATHRLLEEYVRVREDLAEASNRVALFRGELLPSARQAVEVAESSYQSGKSAILDVIDSERTLLDIRKIYWKSVADMHASLIELQTLAGETDPGNK